MAGHRGYRFRPAKRSLRQAVRLTFRQLFSDRNVSEPCKGYSLPLIGENPMLARRLPKHLKRLEAEAIGIMREVVAEFRNPVMLYSIGKDSSAMLHLARKALFPARLPFPLLHIDTGWKFREMISFRDATARDEDRSPQAGARSTRL